MHWPLPLQEDMVYTNIPEYHDPYELSIDDAHTLLAKYTNLGNITPVGLERIKYIMALFWTFGTCCMNSESQAKYASGTCPAFICATRIPQPL